MDKTTQSDIVILSAGLAGVVAAAVVKALRMSGGTEYKVMPLSVPLPELLATVAVVRRASKVAGIYPDKALLMGVAALAIGAGIGLASGKVRGFLPKAA